MSVSTDRRRAAEEDLVEDVNLNGGQLVGQDTVERDVALIAQHRILVEASDLQAQTGLVFAGCVARWRHEWVHGQIVAELDAVEQA